MFNSESGDDLTPCNHPVRFNVAPRRAERGCSHCTPRGCLAFVCRVERPAIIPSTTTHPPQLAVGATVEVLSVGATAKTPVVGISLPFSSADSLSPVSLSRAISGNPMCPSTSPSRQSKKRDSLSEGASKSAQSTFLLQYPKAPKGHHPVDLNTWARRHCHYCIMFLTVRSFSL